MLDAYQVVGGKISLGGDAERRPRLMEGSNPIGQGGQHSRVAVVGQQPVAQVIKWVGQLPVWVQVT
jgi:hypothetical protein